MAMVNHPGRTSGAAVLSPDMLAQYGAALDGEQQWIRPFVPSPALLGLSASYRNFSAGRARPPPQCPPTSVEQSYAALEWATKRGLRALPGYLIPHNQHNRFFEIVQRVAVRHKKAAATSVVLSLKIVQDIFACEAESEDMAFAAKALRRMQALREVDGNVFLGDSSLPPIHHHSAIHVIRKILPTMHSFGQDHGDSPDALVDPDLLTPRETALYERGELLLNARLLGGQHQSTFVECPLGGWRLYQQPAVSGGYLAMDGELRFQGPIFLHGSVHHHWRDVQRPLPERPQHMLNSLKLNVPGTVRFMAQCMLEDFEDGADCGCEHNNQVQQLARRLLDAPS